MKDAIVVISDAFWDDPYWVSRHYIPKYLSRSMPVIYIEKAPTWISPLFYNTPWSKVLQAQRLRKIEGDLYVYSPWPRLPFDRRFRRISKVNQRHLAIEIERECERNGFRTRHVVTFDHKSGELLRHLNTTGKKLYYVVDEVSEFDWPLASKVAIVADEIETIRESDSVLATAPPLLEKCLMHNHNSSLIRHGVEIEGYGKEDLGRPEPLSKLTGPIIGFVGKIETWVDLELIAEAAKRLHDHSFVLVGPIYTETSALLGLTNVYLLGPCAKVEVPRYVKAFDCGIIPFKQNELTANVNPLKLYEYLAGGKPTVSTPMQAVCASTDLGIYVASTTGDFVEAIRTALETDSETSQTTRKAYAHSNSWEYRASEVFALLEKHGVDLEGSPVELPQ